MFSLSLSFILITIGGSTPAVEGFGQAVNNCNDRTITYSIHNSGWSAWHEVAVEESLNSIGTWRGQDGQPLVVWTRQPNNSAADVWINRADLSGNTTGSSTCSWPLQPRAILDVSLFDHRRKIYKTVAHEMMHLSGATHGGRNDSWYNYTPASLNPTRMSTCVSAGDTYDSPIGTFDDFGLLNYLHGNGAGRQLMADSGMETYWDDVWIFHHSLQRSFSTSGSYQGSRHVRVRPTSNQFNSGNSDFMTQHIRILNGNDNETYYGSARVREMSSSYSTTTSVDLYYRAIDYTSAANSCSYPNGLSNSPNGAASIGPWVVAASSTALTGSGWTERRTGLSNPPTADAYDFTVRMRGLSKSGSSYGWIGVDNLTVVGT